MGSPETLRFASNQECILVFLATGDKTNIGADLQGAFAAWHNLSENEKLSLGRHIQESSPINHKLLYDTLVSSFNVWERIQDTEGAPGWRIKESSVAEVLKYIGSDLLQLLNSMEGAWQMMLTESDGCCHVVKKVECLMELPELTSFEKDLAKSAQGTPIASQDKPKSQDQVEDGWTSDRNDRISPADCKKIRAMMSRTLCKDNDSENNKNGVSVSHVSKERLEDHIESSSLAVSPPISQSFEEIDHLRDLLIDDRFDDSDFEKQISPILSVDDNQD